MDLLDPHAIGFSDVSGKAVGLAQYAQTHGQHFACIEMIIKDGEVLSRLDLQNEAIRAQVLKVTTSDQLLQLFEHGE